MKSDGCLTRKDVSSWKLQDLEIRETIGTGTFGRVRLCRHRASGQYVVLKILKKQEILRMKQVDHILAESSILQELSHPFIVTMYKGFMDDDRLYLLLEYVVGGELFSHLRKAGKFPNDVAKFYSAEVVLAFEYIHECGIVYRDLKPENVLLDKQGNIKITDFGFAKRVRDRTYTLCGTPEYLAPEIIQSKGHDRAVDWWTLGILLYEMLVGYPPFFDESPFRTYEKILEGKLQFPKWVEMRAKDLIKSFLTIEPTKRLGSVKRGVQDVKRHKFYSGVNWNVLLQRGVAAPIHVRLNNDGDTRYFDRYPESPRHPLQPLTEAQQELFSGFCDGEYTRI
ncbi:protein kinase A catalytic subunit [Trypanosoma equiperdum]|uniref:Protein kinase A catalytic subunit n=4 Tax=Trypanozoon TaxID=39700 RepID=Q388U5_TRYB2|nr:protein kinase A catalytic subunit [Trypanosoma brucei gambiense DAL972]XP_827787.1 protein kinase A catalytic subunit [Trypanosoma brucei brucei TREU927]RHW69208.1 protein kinase A catalytic subunit [Trypanosoma brucei equiperdum]SCU64246.1 protein kinase A catalytic subunit [Trypanosoma equiperdum]EAN78675.1 protein kinase A catalytic subunit [Trypanosoma brucei brucei TREU927]CBH16470.1 protein kinase A catalytic subunit [Trypanosoma brucei gambiense DAL972]|eukprot:XP_011778734.1 protein kinase A catalytic subunit [Trypanosoma brucei gambiense DAL972]